MKGLRDFVRWHVVAGRKKKKTIYSTDIWPLSQLGVFQI